MVDSVTRKRRSEIMAAVKGKDTRPEKKVRSFLHSYGLRYRLHRKVLPGKPDIVFPKKKLVVFVHGCFWHGHENCKLVRIPKSNVEFWREKIRGNAERDKKVKRQLEDSGWKVLTLWECEINDKRLDRLKNEILRFGQS